jgi:hypothetical protein
MTPDLSGPDHAHVARTGLSLLAEGQATDAFRLPKKVGLQQTAHQGKTGSCLAPARQICLQNCCRAIGFMRDARYAPSRFSWRLSKSHSQPDRLQKW